VLLSGPSLYLGCWHLLPQISRSDFRATAAITPPALPFPAYSSGFHPGAENVSRSGRWRRDGGG